MSGHGTSSVEDRSKTRKGVESFDWSLVSLAWELGYIVAIPLVAFALLGRFADKTLGTSPWLLLFSVLAATVVSSIFVYRKVSKIISNENTKSQALNHK